MLSFDITLFRFINNLAGHSKVLDFFGIFFAQSLAFVLVLVALILIFLNKNWKTSFRNFLFTALVLLVSNGFVANIIEFFYVRARPSLVLENVVVLIQKNLQDPSFPSDHAIFFFALAAVFYFIDRKWFKYFFIGAALMGIARVFVGVHYPLDILMGAIIGSGASLLIGKFYRYNNLI